MEIGDGRLDDQAPARVIEDALTVFRGRHRACRLEWIDISGRCFPHVDAGGLTLVLRTPFQRVEYLWSPTWRGADPVAPYAVDVFASGKVFSARWDHAQTVVDLIVSGPWRRKLSRIAGATLTAPGEVALRLANVRAAHQSVTPALSSHASRRPAAMLRHPGRQAHRGDARPGEVRSGGDFPMGRAKHDDER